jgi:hypothetical protein
MLMGAGGLSGSGVLGIIGVTPSFIGSLTGSLTGSTGTTAGGTLTVSRGTGLGTAGVLGVLGSGAWGTDAWGICSGGEGFVTLATSIGVTLFFTGGPGLISKSKRWQATDNKRKQTIRISRYY